MAGSKGEAHSLRGPSDRPTLLAIRDLFNSEEPLATATVDDILNPDVVNVQYSDGLLAAEWSRIDVQWTTRNDYKYHYTDAAGVNLRWGKHPHNGDYVHVPGKHPHNGDYVHVPGLEHYHPPPDASSNPSDVEESCINQRPETLVTRAVIKLWRTAYHAQSLDPLNAGKNPP